MIAFMVCGMITLQVSTNFTHAFHFQRGRIFTQLGFHVPNFNFPEEDVALFAQIVETRAVQAKENRALIRVGFVDVQARLFGAVNNVSKLLDRLA